MQKVFARVYHATCTITPTQLVVAVESHAGHGEDAEVELSAASAVVSKAVAMDTRGSPLLRDSPEALASIPVDRFYNAH